MLLPYVPVGMKRMSEWVINELCDLLVRHQKTSQHYIQDLKGAMSRYILILFLRAL